MLDLTKLKQRAKYVLQVAMTKVMVLRYRDKPIVRLIFGKGDQIEIYEDIRKEASLVPLGLPAAGAGWCTVTHRNVAAVLRSDSFGHSIKPSEGEAAPPRLESANGQFLTGPDGQRLAQPLGPPSMIAIDPPEHTRQRRLIARAFAPRTIENLRPRVREIADELIDTFDTAGPTDFVAQFASVLPVMVIAELLGIPTADQAWFRSRGYALAQTLDGATLKEAKHAHQALIELNEYFAREMAARRAEPRGDVLSALIAPDESGDTLTDHEALSTALLLLVAGFETTVNLLGSTMALLAERPQLVKEIAADRSLIPNTIEEVLRYESPVQLTSRMAREATTVDGVDVKAGESVMVLLAGANRDPEVFEDPHMFDIRRSNARDHLAFAYGAHVCIGAALARLEGQVALDALLDRFDSFRLDGKSVRRPSRLLRGYNKLPIKFERALATAS